MTYIYKLTEKILGLLTRLTGSKSLRSLKNELGLKKLRAQGYKVGPYSRVNGTLDAVNPGLIDIGSHVVVGVGSAILSHCPVNGPQPVSIGTGVFMGYGVIILPGVSVGDGALIGAGTVVTRDVPPYAVVAGNPGKVIGQASTADVEARKRLLETGRRVGQKDPSTNT